MFQSGGNTGTVRGYFAEFLLPPSLVLLPDNRPLGSEQCEQTWQIIIPGYYSFGTVCSEGYLLHGEEESAETQRNILRTAHCSPEDEWGFSDLMSQVFLEF